MRHVKTTLIGLAVTASLLVPLTDANAWVAAGGYHRYGGYHGVVAVGGYHGGGCYGCGAAGLAVGVMTGAAIASASHPTTVVVQQPATVVVQQPAYVVQGNLPIGTQVASLPPGSSSMVVNGTNYYQSGPTWYKPYFGSSGVYYEVVQVP
jgi:hypothetical protein